MAYADAIPLDLLRSEQDRVAREMEHTKRELTEAKNAERLTNDLYQQAQTLMRRGADIYALAEPDVRRQLHQAFIAKLEIDTEVERMTLASPWREINQAAAHLRQESRVTRTAASPTYLEPRGNAGGGAGPRSKMNPDRLSEGQGSNKNPLVDLRGRFSNPEVRAMVVQVAQLAAGINVQEDQRERPALAPQRQRWRLVDRLGEQVIGDLLRDRHAGATQCALAERYGISLSSVKRLLRNNSHPS
jgi:hypothetical protein